MRTAKILVAAATITLSGCQFGKRGSDLAIAHQPGGARATLEMVSGRYSGELIAVQNDGIVISAGKLMFAPFTALRKLAIDQLGPGYAMNAGDQRDAQKLARLRTVSHFPHGLTPEVQKRLLDRMGQTEILVVQ